MLPTTKLGATPGEELGVGERRTGGDLVGDRVDGGGGSDRIGRPDSEGIGAISQVEQHDGLAGPRLFERSGQQQQRVSAAGLTDGRRDVIGQDISTTRELGARRLDRAWVHACDQQAVDSVSLDASVSQHAGERLGCHGGVPSLSESLLPDPRAGVARGPPPIEELVGGGAPADELGDDRSVVGPLAHDHCGRSIAAARLVGRRGQAVTHVGDDYESLPASIKRAEECTSPRAQRAPDVIGAD